MPEVFIIIIEDADKARKLLRKFSKNGYGVIKAVAVAVEVPDARVLGGFVSQYKAQIVKSLLITPNLT